MQSNPGLSSLNNKGAVTVNSVGHAVEQATHSIMLFVLAVYVIQSSQVFLSMYPVSTCIMSSGEDMFTYLTNRSLEVS